MEPPFPVSWIRHCISTQKVSTIFVNDLPCADAREACTYTGSKKPVQTPRCQDTDTLLSVEARNTKKKKRLGFEVSVECAIKRKALTVSEMVFACSSCSFICEERLTLIKHHFSSHCFEPGFSLTCGIQHCMHTFKFGSTFSSFKSHANRKHCHWQQSLSEALNEGSTNSTPSNSINNSEYVNSGAVDTTPEHHLPPSPSLDDQSLDATTSEVAKKRAALFLLTFKEKYVIPQTAINFAVGSIRNLIGDAVI